MAEESPQTPPASTTSQPNANLAAASSPLKQQIANEFKDMALREPDKFGAFFQLFFPDPDGAKTIPQAVVEKAIDYQKGKDSQNHTFRLCVIGAIVLVAAILLGTAITLVCLMRDHIEFVDKIVESIGLVVSHGIVGSGAWALGRAQAKSVPIQTTKAPNISADTKGQ